MVLFRPILLVAHILLRLQKRSGIIEAIKDLSVSSLSLIGFEVEWHSSRSDKWHQSQGHGFESQECHYEGEIVGRP